MAARPISIDRYLSYSCRAISPATIDSFPFGDLRQPQLFCPLFLRYFNATLPRAFQNPDAAVGGVEVHQRAALSDVALQVSLAAARSARRAMPAGWW